MIQMKKNAEYRSFTRENSFWADNCLCAGHKKKLREEKQKYFILQNNLPPQKYSEKKHQ